MPPECVSLIPYREPGTSVRQAVDQAGGLPKLSPGARIFIKPNIVFWTKAADFPKWGVITTSRVVRDMVELLAEHGYRNIRIGEGSITFKPKDRQTQLNAFERLGYTALAKRYGVKLDPLLNGTFSKIDLDDGLELGYSDSVLESDLIIDLPVLKTHAQTMVSLGIKNLKGCLDIPSRKRCHSADPVRDLHFHIARLADPLPPVFTLIDGIFSIERGPGFDGRPRRSDLLLASRDLLSADLVGAKLLGFDPGYVPHLRLAAENRSRTTDCSDVEAVGLSVEEAAGTYEWSFPYDESGVLPRPLAKMGIRGLSYPKYDSTLCTYCSILNGLVLTAIAQAWSGQPFDEVEVLTGKVMQPTPGKRRTVLLGKCMSRVNSEHPDIQEAIPVPTCPPKPADINAALKRAGIEVDPQILEQAEAMPAFLLSKFKDRPEFEEAFYRIDDL